MVGIEEIDVHIDAAGRVKIEVRGAVGKTCEAMTHDLEQMLGGVVVERVYQDSYHRHDAEQAQDESQDDRA